ncbi:hypothetical protein HYH03_016269 [Edaphochlamys debaryana]|uniref:Ysc84 actin-binding domain-containing protein n=1 Tax=Edaphochlamys debaryana TaxID=47281 RepID=A0A835XKN4_9CHLO|nr:hypothetical protein HYH03_016269 [Edaphochlamys debaryana]|eukprot:KAG2484972.1 hypothetical protein HYH03_016269 [Edaphochlamys debaryana]
MHSHKAAAVVGVETGGGVAYGVLGHQEDGTPILSSPVLMKMSKVTVGLQLGYNSIFTMLAVFDQAQMDAIVSSHTGTIVGRDMDITAVLCGTANKETKATGALHRTSVSMLDDTPQKPPEKMRIVTISDSLMVVDMSVYGGTLAVDDELMLKIYHEDFAPLTVLHGKTETPADFREGQARAAALLKSLAAEVEAEVLHRQSMGMGRTSMGRGSAGLNRGSGGLNRGSAGKGGSPTGSQTAAAPAVPAAPAPADEATSAATAPVPTPTPTPA